LEYHVNKNDIINFTVSHKEHLAKKYLNKFVNCSDLLNDKEIQIIKNNQSVILIHDNNIVGAVIRDVTTKKVSDYIGAIIKATIQVYNPINRGKQHRSSGQMVAHGHRSNRTPLPTYNYLYKDRKNLDSIIQNIYDNDGNTLYKWIFENGKHYLPIAISSYEEFKKLVNLNDDIIGAVFCVKNYEAEGHRDNDRSNWAIGYVYEEGIVSEGYFFYPEYGVAIEMTSNSIWCWLTKAVHGTARLNTESGIRYTTAITLTEKTAISIEKLSNLH